MNFVKNVATTMVVYAAAAAASIVGMCAGSKLWEHKIEPAIEKKLRKED